MNSLKRFLLVQCILGAAFFLAFTNALAQKPTKATRKPVVSVAMTSKQRDNALLASLKKSDTLEVRRLLKQKANPNAVDSENGGRTALLCAILSVDLNKISMKAEEREKIRKSMSDENRDAMDTFRGNLEYVSLLLNAGADPNLTDKSGRTPLMAAAMCGNEDECKLLLKFNANLNSADRTKPTPLMFASASLNLQLCKFLIDNGAEVNPKNDKGETPLMYALMGDSKSKSILGLNLVKGIDRFLPKDEDVFDLLLSKGADFHTLTEDGDSLLLLAVGLGNIERSRLFIDLGLNPNRLNKMGMTPLIYASGIGNAEMVRFLLDSGADPNLIGFGGTPLMVAVLKSNYAIIEMLLAKGANLSAKADKGETALSIALQKKCTAIVNQLKAAGAKE